VFGQLILQPLIVFDSMARAEAADDGGFPHIGAIST
jgi:hypothetical protein